MERLTDDPDTLKDLLKKPDSLIGDLHLRLTSTDEDREQVRLERDPSDEHSETDERRWTEQGDEDDQSDDDLDRLGKHSRKKGSQSRSLMSLDEGD